MTTTTETTTAGTCPLSAIADQILPWGEVKARDLVLWDGELCPVESNEPYAGDPSIRMVMLAGDAFPGCIPAGRYAAVRRYTEGTSERDALVIAALDEAAEERAYRANESCHACGTSDSGMCDEHRGHLDMAEQYRAERDRREAGR